MNTNTSPSRSRRPVRLALLLILVGFALWGGLNHAAEAQSGDLIVTVEAPEAVAPSDEFLIEVTVRNETGRALGRVVVEAAVDAAFSDIRPRTDGVLDEANRTVSWRFPILPNGYEESMRVRVTAPEEADQTLAALDVSVTASNWPEAVAAAPVETTIDALFGLVTIEAIQRHGDEDTNSPLNGETVRVRGIVYAVYGEAFAMAEAEGAWHGIYVYHPDGPLPDVGDEVEVKAGVQEYYGVTELGFPDAVEILSSGNEPYPATVVATGDLATGSEAAESYEGVFVEVRDVTVVDTNPDAPNNYGEWAIDDGSGPVRVDDLGRYTYRPTAGDVLPVVRGMHHYSFSHFKIEPRDDADLGVEREPAIEATIPEIQGNGSASPLDGTNVTVAGVVTGLFEGNYPGGGAFDGVFVQDPAGDDDPATSDGILVLGDIDAAVGVGLTVTGVVREFGEFDNFACTALCMTVIVADTWETGDVVDATIAPVPFTPPTDTADEPAYLESLEGMLVALEGEATVVGPTDFGTIQVISAAEGVTRVYRGSPQQGKNVGVRHFERYGDIEGRDAPSLIVGSRVENVDGPLVTTYGAFAVVTQADDAWAVVEAAAPFRSPSADTFSVLSFNTENMDADDTTKRTKAIATLVALNCPTIVALQEVDTVSSLPGDDDTVLPALQAGLEAVGCPYEAAFTHPDVGDHGVALLWRSDVVTDATWAALAPSCSEAGSPSAVEYDDACADEGTLPLFSRRPLVWQGEIPLDGETVPVVVIANHFKSKIGGAPSDQRRLEQAQAVEAAVAALDGARVIVLGDLNDFVDSPPLSALTADGRLYNLWDGYAGDDRYTFNFNGVSQILDHILVSPALADSLVLFDVVHLNSDFPYLPFAEDEGTVWRVSDHDLLFATFTRGGEGEPQRP